MKDTRNLHFIAQVQSLMRMPRAHVRSLGTSYDTIASHSHHVSLIAYVIARMEGLTLEEGLRAMAMGTLHDLAEARTGDADFIAKHYVTIDEKKALEDQFVSVAGGGDMHMLLEEYQVRETPVSKCAKDADSLAQIAMEWDLMWQGNKLAGKWFEDDFKNRVPHLYTASAKEIALSMKESNPSEWWWCELVDEEGHVKNPDNLRR